MKQRTLKSSINCTGIALHSGVKASMRLRPADPDTGIVFVRTDVAGQGSRIPARWDQVVDTRMCTVLGNKQGVTISTVEHLMAALSGCRIDNAIIEINGPEIPVMDGSAAPFIFLVECAGVVEQPRPRKAVKILKPIELSDGSRRVTLKPGQGFSVDFRIDFDNAVIDTQEAAIAMSGSIFKKEISRARTFGFLQEVEQLRAMGLARGGSTDNAVVISGDGVLNDDGLRYDDEFVRHKILDAVGDLYLAGHPIIGHFEGLRSGHAMNNQLLHALFADASAWSFVETEQAEIQGGYFAGGAVEDIAATA